MAAWASTGLQGLDDILTGLQKGDNVVWQVDHIDHFRNFVDPYVAKAVQDGRKVVYMRFANHEPLVAPGPSVTIHQLDADSGFETFSAHVHTIITDEGKEAFYVFDCLSDLLSAWATDLMIGNFFMITCPYLFELDTIAYFALLRNNHSFQTIARIRETTQILIDLYHFKENFYVHPLKVWRRYSPTMFLPHIRKKDDFVPITNSVEAATLISYISGRGLEPAQRVLDYWDRMFLQAEELSKDPDSTDAEKDKTIEHLCRMMIGREDRILSLSKVHFSLQDVLDVRKRMIGTGFIGGKAVGMLLANKIVANEGMSESLEPHDSFYVGSDVFYTYLVENGWWKLRMDQKTPDGYFAVASQLKDKLLTGKFPHQIREQFQGMIEYFGQSPIIVRSSSLLEDAFGNAFAGKYESFFLVSQGSPEERYERFEEAVRKVYASMMSESALTYRLQRGLDQEDEQMALLIQRVSGSYRNGYFFPDLAGVGFSHNTFVWNSEMDPKAGMIRLVFGLGTRAVNRVEDDYPRIVPLDAPLLRPVAGSEDVRKFSQHRVDLLDMQQNKQLTVDLQELLKGELNINLDMVAVRDFELARRAKQMGRPAPDYWLLTFKKLLSETSFVGTMQRILKRLEDSYDYPVDIEFTANFTSDGSLIVNLLQCRPLQTKGLQPTVKLPPNPDPDRVLFETGGYFMGGSISQTLEYVVYVDPAAYIDMPIAKKYEVARVIGKLNRQICDRESSPAMLMGPGRWGTSTPSLGVPVNFHEISNATVLAEVAYEGGNLMPELSFGTHFFQDLVESDIYYVALFPQKPEVTFNRDKLRQRANLLPELLSDAEKFADCVHVCCVEHEDLHIVADMLKRKVLCYFV